jgi:hypothetical protein
MMNWEKFKKKIIYFFFIIYLYQYIIFISIKKIIENLKEKVFRKIKIIKRYKTILRVKIQAMRKTFRGLLKKMKRK